ncbi:hypothetical protein pEaSNUABM50_00201 [Erwinia phage pEa_SNUABM_50]|uniref:Uncharacterized protein n=4 Tax=Eneladusvirus BF TaxID=2560751 RepID=A0A7L8ZMH8_9CAUD|nr:hypothetical protein FDH34_gp205 [Serratia phage BF]QOI71142.1 hypothetical protein pEaSNUABM12_00204 [Erwinia phage pEa_SNUABM_12]QOI71686.1 hypothetical protein pEaSNUABM47_00202 [Erwinia phage pEa_SNUABM_47]QOI72225.1 hypothetical protein pEaSNUABM50_00201 [Erwinia phage pEa_SNUABM_50]QXO11351.1 hypothetical protein pEaSNUABM19_00205 [Erwinia phage pEa_SNUABM_19]QXO11899.1 hypothetical protein pEaSNUABM44_00203 [Erwinia phage pEa_SNUABM_44]QXO12451.1 hypothetical protein pEaSNUABM49_002
MKAKRSVEEALGLPSTDELKKILGDNYDENDLYSDEDDEDSTEITGVDVDEARRSMQQLKEYREQLKDIPDITNRKSHLDRLAKLAEDKFEDIFDRGFNCEDRFMAEIINAANAMLKIALDAHSKVIDSDIKLIDMQIKKDKMEIELNLKPKTALANNSDPNSIEGEKVVVKSRNELLASMNRNK